MDPSARAVVLVSGGSSISPFTTPEAACGEGLAAGNTDTFLREGLLAAGFRVFTAPSCPGGGVVTEDPGWSGFASVPEALPAELTVDSVGDLDNAGASLARFLGFLAERYGCTEFDLVCHSMGGLFSRSAIRQLGEAGSPLAVRTLTAIGTPWTGSFPADHNLGDLPLSAAGGDPRMEHLLVEFARQVQEFPDGGAKEQVTAAYLAGADGWNARQAGVLNTVMVTLIGGAVFSLDGGSPRMWPSDGLVSLASSLALDVPSAVLPQAQRHTFPDGHSIFLCDQFGLPWQRSLTWDPDVLAVVVAAIERGRSGD